MVDIGHKKSGLLLSKQQTASMDLYKISIASSFTSNQ